VQISTMDTNHFAVQISAVTTQPQFGVFQNPMAQNVPSLGQQFMPPQFQPMLGNIPSHPTNPAGTYVRKLRPKFVKLYKL